MFGYKWIERTSNNYVDSKFLISTSRVWIADNSVMRHTFTDNTFMNRWSRKSDHNAEFHSLLFVDTPKRGPARSWLAFTRNLCLLSIINNRAYVAQSKPLLKPAKIIPAGWCSWRKSNMCSSNTWRYSYAMRLTWTKKISFTFVCNNGQTIVTATTRAERE